MSDWIKACGSNACIEVLFLHDGVLLRSTDEPDDWIAASAAEWSEFVAGVKAGVFDQLPPGASS